MWVIEEVLDETTVKEIAVNVQILMPVDHIFVLERICGVPDLAIL